MADTRGWSRDEKDERADTLAALIQKAWRAVMRALVGKQTTRISMSDLNELPSLWAQQVDGPLLGYLGTQVLDGAERVRQDLGLGDKAFLLTEDFVEQHLQLAANRFQDLSQEVWDAIHTQLIRGYALDEDVKQIAARIKHVGNVSDSKALTIARTEIHAALEAGSYAQAAMVDPDGKKSWLATNDTHTRPTHVAADGQTQKIVEPFTVGRSQMQYPGDPHGPLDETINCRCSVTYALFPDESADENEYELALLSAGYPWAKGKPNWDPKKHPRDDIGRFTEEELAHLEKLKALHEAERITRKYNDRSPSQIAAMARHNPEAFLILPAEQRGKTGDRYRVQNKTPKLNIWGRYGSAGIMMRAKGDDGEDRFLMLQRGKGVSNPNKWQLPGGALDEHETPAQGAARETYEELHATQAYLDKVKWIGTHEVEQPIVDHNGDDEDPWYYTNIAADAPEMFEPNVDKSETQDAKWLTRAEIERMARDGELHPALVSGLDRLFKVFDTGRSTVEIKGVVQREKPYVPPPKKQENYLLNIDDLTAASVPGRKWEAEEHPRGKDGKFISKGPLADFFKMKSPTLVALQQAVESIDDQDSWDNLTEKQKGWISKLVHGVSSSSMTDSLKAKITKFENKGSDGTTISTPVPDKIPTPNVTEFTTDEASKYLDEYAVGDVMGTFTASKPGKKVTYSLVKTKSGAAIAYKVTGAYGTGGHNLGYADNSGKQTYGHEKPYVIKGTWKKAKPGKKLDSPTKHLEYWLKTDPNILEKNADTSPASNVTPKITSSELTPSSNKFVPATIHKPQQDGAIVALSGNGQHRIRWDAASKKYQLQTLAVDKWATDKSMTKAGAYSLAKEDAWDWRQPKKSASPPPTPTTEEPKKAKVSAHVDAMNPLSLADYKQVGPQAGSNPGGLFESPSGKKIYAKKAKSVDHAKNEVLASMLYNMGGIDTPQVRFGTGTPGLGLGVHTYTDIVPDSKKDLQGKLNDKDYVAKVRDGFAMDAWLANWDVAGLNYDNIVTDHNGDPVRIDVGGALLYRAQGTPKGEALRDVATELDSLRDSKKNPTSAKLFGDMTDDEIRASAAHVASITPEQIDAAVAKVGLPSSLAAKLKKRREDVLKKFPPPTAEPSTPEVTAPEPLTLEPVLTPNTMHDTIGLNILSLAKIADPGEVLIKGYNKDGNPVTIRKTNLGYPLAAYEERGDGTSFAQFHNENEFSEWWTSATGGNDIAWDINTLGAKTKAVNTKTKSDQSLTDKVVAIGSNAKPGQMLMSGELDSEQVYLKKGDGLSYEVVDDNGDTFQVAADTYDLTNILRDDDYTWNPESLANITSTPTKSDTWWEPEDELNVDDMADAGLFNTPGTTIGVTTDGSLVMTYNPNTIQLEISKLENSTGKWVVATKNLGLPGDDPEWEDDLAEITKYHSNEGVKTWLKGDVAVPHFGVPANITQHNAAIDGAVLTGQYGDDNSVSLTSEAWKQKLSPELIATFIPDQIIATVENDTGSYRIISGGTKHLSTGFRIQKKNTIGGWTTLEINITAAELPLAAEAHSGTMNWNIVNFDPPKPAPNPGADITNMSPAQVGVLKTYFNANGAKWHNKPEAIWDALQSFKSSDASVGYEHLTNMQILAALDTGLPPSAPSNSSYTNKLKKWLKTSKGLDYIIAHPDVKKPTVLPASSDEHPGTSLIMKALAHPNMKNYTVIGSKNLENDDHLTLEKGQFGQGVLVYKNGTPLLKLEPNEIDSYLKMHDDDGDSWKIYPTPDGTPVYVTMSNKKPPATPEGIITPQTVKSFEDMDKWPWAPGDIVATRADGEWRITYTDQGKFSLETNVGTNDNPEWTTMLGMTENQRSLLGFFPLDVHNMTQTWYAGKPSGSDPTLTPGLASKQSTFDQIWDHTPDTQATAGKIVAYGTSNSGNNNKYVIKQDGDGEGYKKLSVWSAGPDGKNLGVSFTSKESFDKYMNSGVAIDWEVAPPTTAGDITHMSYAPAAGSPKLQDVVWSKFNSNAANNEILATATNADNDAYVFIKKVKPNGASYIEVQKNNTYNNQLQSEDHVKNYVNNHGLSITAVSNVSTPIVDKFTGLSTTPNAFPLKDGTPASTGYTIPSDGWESLGDINTGTGYKIHAVTPGKDLILVSNYGDYQIRKYDSSLNKYVYFTEGKHPKKLAQDHSDYWNYASGHISGSKVTSEPSSTPTTPTPPATPKLTLPDGTTVDKGPEVKVWKDLVTKKNTGQVLAYSQSGKYKLSANYGFFYLHKWDEDNKKWAYVSGEQYKLASLAKMVKTKWYDATSPELKPAKPAPATLKYPMSSPSAPTPPSVPTPPAPLPKPTGIYGTITLPDGTDVPKGPKVGAWGPISKKNQYKATTTLAYASNGKYRIVYHKPGSEFQLQAWNPSLNSWTTTHTESYKVATLANSAPVTSWYKPEATVPTVKTSHSASIVMVPGGGTIDMGGGDISHLSDVQKQQVYSQFKSQPATYLKSSSQDIWAALITIADNNNLTKMQTLRVIDEVGAAKVSKPDDHLFEKKITDWLQTPAGYAILHNLPIPKPPPPKFMPGVEGNIPTLEESNKYTYSVLDTSSATSWFNKALAAFKKATGQEPSSSAKNGVTNYTGGIYHSINAFLYGKVQGISSSNEQSMNNAQAAMIPSIEPVLLHRGVGFDAFKATSYDSLAKMVGQTRWMGGFGSTSTGGHSAFGGHVTVEIEAPPGTPMYWAKPISLHKGENEMLLAAGLYYHILSVTPKYGGGATVRVRIVPKPDDESQIIAAVDAGMMWR